MTTIAETASAKLNLALHVRRRRADGYHELETIFAFCAEGDRLTAAAADALSLTVTGPFWAALAGSDGVEPKEEGPPPTPRANAGGEKKNEENLVLRAARALQAAAGVSFGAAIALDKRLPVAAGLGGGSADAAAALRGLNALWGLGLAEEALVGIARGLGADVAACVASRTCRGEGVGDRLAVADGSGLSGRPVLLVNPGVELATGPVFRAWDGVDRGALAEGDPLATALAGRNDLEAPAGALRPEIGAVLALLQAQPGVTLARMSGSGATCFALFADAGARDAADRAVASAEPRWWRCATVLR